jgi:hypothetical protein
MREGGSEPVKLLAFITSNPGIRLASFTTSFSSYVFISNLFVLGRTDQIRIRISPIDAGGSVQSVCF